MPFPSTGCGSDGVPDDRGASTVHPDEVVVVPLTTAHRGLPSHVEIEPGETGLDQISYAKCEDVKSVSDQRLVGRLGVASPEPLFAIGRVLRYLLDL